MFKFGDKVCVSADVPFCQSLLDDREPCPMAGKETVVTDDFGCDGATVKTDLCGECLMPLRYLKLLKED